MRWHILRALLHKEALRHLANKGGLALLGLLLVAALLLGVFGGREGNALAPATKRCFVDYWEDSDFVRYLRAHVPEELADSVVFRALRDVRTDANGTIVYPQNTGAIQLRERAGSGWRVSFWRPGGDPAGLAPYEAWFWREALRFQQRQARVALGRTDAAALLPEVHDERSALKGGLDPRSGMTTALVMFGLFFVCVYLLPSLTCEERERGVLLAQALSPASPTEILAAKFLFYPVVGVAVAVLLAATCAPAALLRPFFWAALVVNAAGAVGVGLTIATLAKTQRAASMGALCYLLSVSLLLFICQQANVPFLSYLALEYHGPRMLHAALTDSVLWYHRLSLAGAAGLAAVWIALAAALFRRRGWQ
jgi:hypothetical protein